MYNTRTKQVTMSELITSDIENIANDIPNKNTVYHNKNVSNLKKLLSEFANCAKQYYSDITSCDRFHVNTKKYNALVIDAFEKIVSRKGYEIFYSSDNQEVFVEF